MRLVMFAAMAAFLVVALCVPGAFGDEALLFACAYVVVRFAQIALFMIASRDDPGLRHSVLGLAISTGDRRRAARRAPRSPTGPLQGAMWALALAARHGRAAADRLERLAARCPATSPSATG